MLLANFTARIEGHPSDALSKKYSIRGFPTLMLLDADGNKVATPAGRSIDAFDSSLGNLRELDSLRERESNGEAGLAASILLAELRLGSVDLEQGTKSRESLVKPKKVRKSQWESDLAEIDALLFNLKLADLFQNTGRDEESQAALSEELYAMAKNGKFASGDMAARYWSVVMGAAKKNKDKKIFGQGYETLYEMYKDNPRATEYLAGIKTELDAMK